MATLLCKASYNRCNHAVTYNHIIDNSNLILKNITTKIPYFRYDPGNLFCFQSPKITLDSYVIPDENSKKKYRNFMKIAREINDVEGEGETKEEENKRKRKFECIY